MGFGASVTDKDFKVAIRADKGARLSFWDIPEGFHQRQDCVAEAYCRGNAAFQEAGQITVMNVGDKSAEPVDVDDPARKSIFSRFWISFSNVLKMGDPAAELGENAGAVEGEMSGYGGKNVPSVERRTDGNSEKPLLRQMNHLFVGGFIQESKEPIVRTNKEGTEGVDQNGKAGGADARIHDTDKNGSFGEFAKGGG